MGIAQTCDRIALMLHLRAAMCAFWIVVGNETPTAWTVRQSVGNLIEQFLRLGFPDDFLIAGSVDDV